MTDVYAYAEVRDVAPGQGFSACATGAVGRLLETVPLADRPRMGIVLGTVTGCLETDRAFDRSRRDTPRFASPAAFARTLPSTLLAEISLAHALTGPSLLLADGLDVVLWRAARWVRAFALPWCLAGTFEEDPGAAHLLLLGTNPANATGRIHVESGQGQVLPLAQKSAP